ncbi:YmaF family protein [Clostridium sp. CCUG 7971]|nr:YmaF family protein [Clostridium sp. CCUG 7971]MBO3446141.1 YmaF family protein [Clostridium sp. CCUG 7971]
MSCQNFRCFRDCDRDRDRDRDRCFRECDRDRDRCFRECDREDNMPNGMQRHVHELEESVKLAEMCEDRHNHRTAAVTGQAIPINNGRNHVHRVDTRTDFLDHFHRIDVFTGPALFIPGTNKHIHLVRGFTSVNDGHRHAFLFTTQIDAPLV